MKRSTTPNRRNKSKRLCRSQLAWKTRTSFSKNAEAFTRLDLAAAVGVSTLFLLVVVPLLAHGPQRSQAAVCLNNLRQIGRAIATWNADHGAADPWRVDIFGGGTRNHWSGLQNNIWFQFSWLTNELRTPRILACPSDSLVRPAANFGFSSDGGFLDVNYRNQAISYFIGLDSVPDSPQSLFSGDRHVRVGPASGSCSSGVSPVYQPLPDTVWNPTNLHGSFGNLLFHDGRVEWKSNAGLQAALTPGLADDNGSVHTLTPRPGN